MRRRQDGRSAVFKLSMACLTAAILGPKPASAQGEVTEVLESLSGVRYLNETTVGPLDHVSMAGGLQLFIDGYGFDEEAHVNRVFIQSEENPDIVLPGPPLNIDDEIQSAPTSGRLAYTLPSLPELYAKPYEFFAAHYALSGTQDETIGHFVQVLETDSRRQLVCSRTWKCRINYSYRYTPQLFDITPSNVYLDQQITL
jgi:hypothetical protein